MTNKNRMTNKTSNGNGKCGGPSTSVGMTHHRMHNPTHAMRPHEWGTRLPPERQGQEQMRGSLRCALRAAVGMTDHRMHDPTHAMRPHEWGTRICGGWGSRPVTHSSHKTQAR
jgi:hypothetical protein